MTDPYRGLVTFPDYLREVAALLGRQRLAITEPQVSPADHRGAHQTATAYHGVLGELIARDYLFHIGRPYRASPLVADGPRPEPDILFAEFRIDVKCTPAYHSRHLVNVRSHLKTSKRLTHYWFFHLLPNRPNRPNSHAAHAFVYPYALISTWPIDRKLPSPAYALDVTETLRRLNTKPLPQSL